MSLTRAAVGLLAVLLVLAGCDPADSPDAADKGDPGEIVSPEVPAEGASPEAPTVTVTPGPPEVEGGEPFEATLPPPDLDRPEGTVGRGVTAEPCPAAANPDNGCIYLGALEDLGRGDAGRVGVAASAGRRAFWERVNERGGIGGYDIDATTYVRDTGAAVQTHRQSFAEIHSEVLALAASRGTAATAGLLPLLRETGMAALVTPAVSGWSTSEHVFTVGANVCAQAAGAVDDAVVASSSGAAGNGGITVVTHPGTFGQDAAAGAALAASQYRGRSLHVTVPAEEPSSGVEGAVADVLASSPDVVVVATGAAVLEQVATALVEGGFEGAVVALADGWDSRLAERLPRAVAAQLRVVGPWAPWGAQTPGHAALRDGLDDGVEPSEAHVAGWVSQYPLATALAAAVDAGELTPEGVRGALLQVEGFASDGMLPAGEAAGVTVEARSVVSAVDPDAPTGLAARSGHLAGPAARTLAPSVPCEAPSR